MDFLKVFPSLYDAKSPQRPFPALRATVLMAIITILEQNIMPEEIYPRTHLCFVKKAAIRVFGRFGTH